MTQDLEDVRHESDGQVAVTIDRAERANGSRAARAASSGKREPDVATHVVGH